MHFVFHAFSPNYLIMQEASQRLAVPAWGERVDSPSKWESAQAGNMLKKRGAYTKSGARCVSHRLWKAQVTFVQSDDLFLAHLLIER